MYRVVCTSVDGWFTEALLTNSSNIYYLWSGETDATRSWSLFSLVQVAYPAYSLYISTLPLKLYTGWPAYLGMRLCVKGGPLWTCLKPCQLLGHSDSKNPFHTNPKCGVRDAPPYSMGILLSFGGFIHNTYPWLQNCSLGHVIWATGCRDMINLKQQYDGKGVFTFELMTRISVKS